MVFLPKIHHPRVTMRRKTNIGHNQLKGTYKYLLKTFVPFSQLLYHFSQFPLFLCFKSQLWIFVL